MSKNDSTRLMTETTFYILLSLVEPLHGYALMKKVEELSEGTVTIGAGTLYGAFSTLVKERLIEIIQEDNRRKTYYLTNKGKKVLSEQIHKFAIMAKNGRKVLPEIQQGF
ncbi:MAG: PadR family transcriptional regulator [Candidatus Thorarchaeota archaeon]